MRCSSARLPDAFVTTEGFRDILALQRHGRARIYDLEYQKPKPVVTRRRASKVTERILAERNDRNAAGRCRRQPASWHRH